LVVKIDIYTTPARNPVPLVSLDERQYSRKNFNFALYIVMIFGTGVHSCQDLVNSVVLKSKGDVL